MLKNSLFIFVFFLSLTLASALTITPTSIEINKTVGVNYEINLNISNNLGFKMFNITSDSNILSFPKTDLDIGETKNITAVISTNSDFEGEIVFYGFYEAQIGQQDETHYLDIDENGVDNCNLVVVKGDKIIFNNLWNREIKLTNIDTRVDITTIPENSSSQPIPLENPLTLNYRASWWGFVFDTCKITVLDTTGLINNPEHDFILNLKVNIKYEPTTLSTTFYNTDYSVTFYGSQEGVLTIKNIGSEIARNINLEADWFSFTPNNFDLETGVSKNINYVISPVISSTEQTNKTYEKELTISGNFDNIYKNFSIFVEHANIDEEIGNFTINQEIIKYLILKYCADNPEIDFCQPQVIYRIMNETDDSFNVTYYKGQVIGFYDLVFESLREFGVFQNYEKEKEDSQNLRLGNIEQSQNKSSEDIAKLVEKMDESNSVRLALWIVFLGIITLGFVVSIMLYLIRRNKIKKYSEYK